MIDTTLTPPGSDTLDASDAWSRALARHHRRVDVLERAVLALMDGELDAELCELAESEAHALAGTIPVAVSGGGARLARALEQSFGARHTLDRSVAARLADQVLALRHELDRPMAPGTVDEPARRVHVINTSPERAEQYVAGGIGRGVLVSSGSLDNALREVAGRPPRAIILEVTDDGQERALALLEELGRTGVPLLVLSEGDGMALRLAIVRAGAAGPLPLTHAPQETLLRAEQVIDTTQPAESVALVVDSDAFALHLAGLTLGRDGLRVHLLSDPMRFWETIEAVSPDVIVLGLSPAGVSGLDLCRALRADPRWRETPVVFLAASTDGVRAREAYQAGADDVVRKPVEPSELGARVRNRIHRSRAVRRQAETDPVTGLSTPRKAERDLDRFIRLARRHVHPITVVVFRLDRLREVAERHGQAAADRVVRWFAQLLTQSFRLEDVTSRWRPDEFVVGLLDARLADGVTRVRAIMGALPAHRFPTGDGDTFSATCSAGLAVFPDDAGDVRGLLEAADAALLLGGANTTSEVLGIASEPHGRVAGRVDVLLVEPDAAIAALLVHTLESRRYEVRWLRDGQEAAAALLGEKPEIRARVVILEVGLPGLDGLSVLRSLATEDKLKHTRVMMLSVRSTEAETVHAFELGAFDYVAKPFSVPVLVERIRRALAT